MQPLRGHFWADLNSLFILFCEIHPCCCVKQYSSFFFISDWHFLEWLYEHWYIPSSVDGHLSFCQFLTRMNKVAIDILARVFWWMSALISLGYILRSGMNKDYVSLKVTKTCDSTFPKVKLWGRGGESALKVPLGNCVPHSGLWRGE